MTSSSLKPPRNTARAANTRNHRLSVGWWSVSEFKALVNILLRCARSRDLKAGWS
jgi:hypothetical protein